MQNNSNLDYQGRLKRVAALYLKRTPQAFKEALGEIESIPHTEPFSIGNIVWGPIISSLKDPDVYENIVALSRVHAILSGISRSVMRTYVKYDFRPDWDVVEHAWYEKLVEVWHFLQGFPFADVDQAVVEYEGSKKALQSLSENAPVVSIYREKIYGFVLREVTAALVSIDLQMSQIKAGYISPAPPYSVILDHDKWAKDAFPPDISHILVWVERALGSISGRHWIIVTWQLSGKSLVLSLR